MKRILGSTVIVAAVFVATTICATESNQSGVLNYLTALDALERGDWSRAIASLDKALVADEENADYYLARGVASIFAERLSDAFRDLNRADRLRAGHEPTRMWLANTLAMQGRFREDANYFPAATRDPYQTATREMSRAYGEPAFRKNELRQPVEQRHLRQQAKAKEKFAKLARDFVKRTKPAGAAIVAALRTRGIERFKQRQYAAALADLQVVRREYPQDLEVILPIAECKRLTGALEGARSDFTIVLTRDVNSCDAYRGRAFVHAGLGSSKLARADFAILEQLDPQMANRHRKRFEPELAGTASRRPDDPVSMLDDMYHATKSEQALAGLRHQAVALSKAVHRGRLRADETYQRRLRHLKFVVDSKPNDADAQSELGQFLYENAVTVLTEWVEPRSEPTPYRPQSFDSQQYELDEAERALDAALRSNPSHARAMAFKAACLMRRTEWEQANALLRRALELHPHDAHVLEMFASVLDHAAAVKLSAASDLRSADKWYTYRYIYIRYPSKAEKALASEYERQARELWRLAKHSLEAAAEAKRGTPHGFYYEALLAERAGDTQAARIALEKAVQLDSKYVAAWQRLGQIYGALKMVEPMHQAQQSAANLTHTTAGPMLKLAWMQIGRTAYKSAGRALDRAAKADPADPRVAAYRAIAAREQGRMADAAAWMLVAALLSEAETTLRGIRPDDESGPLDRNEVGQLVALRYLAGELALEQKRPNQASTLLRSNLRSYDRVDEAERYRPLVRAMFPETLQDGPTPSLTPVAPNLETLLAWTRLRLGEALLATGKLDEAAEHFEWAMQFESRKPSVLDVGSMIRLPAKLANIQLVKVAVAKGDMNAARGYLTFVGRPRFLPPEAAAELSQLQMKVTGRSVSPIVPRGNSASPSSNSPLVPRNPNDFRIQQMERQLASMKLTLRRARLGPDTRKRAEESIRRFEKEIERLRRQR